MTYSSGSAPQNTHASNLGVSGWAGAPGRVFTVFPESYDRKGFQEWCAGIGRAVTGDPIANAKAAVIRNLRAYTGRGTAGDEDRLFAEHTWLVEQLRDGKITNSDP